MLHKEERIELSSFSNTRVLLNVSSVFSRTREASFYLRILVQRRCVIVYVHAKYVTCIFILFVMTRT